MNAITIILLIILVGSFIGAFRELIQFEYEQYKDKKAKKEFDKRQEKYKRMI